MRGVQYLKTSFYALAFLIDGWWLRRAMPNVIAPQIAAGADLQVCAPKAQSIVGYVNLSANLVSIWAGERSPSTDGLRGAREIGIIRRAL